MRRQIEEAGSGSMRARVFLVASPYSSRANPTWEFLTVILVVGFPAELLLVIMIEKLTRFDYRPLLNVRVRNGVGDHHPD